MAIGHSIRIGFNIIIIRFFFFNFHFLHMFEYIHLLQVFKCSSIAS